MRRLGAVAALVSALPAAAVDLPAAWQAAMSADPAVMSAAANRDAALENRNVARARLLPQISFQAMRQKLDQTTEQDVVSRDFSGYAQSKQLSLRQAVFRPRDYLGIEVGKRQAEIGEHKLESVYSDLWSRTAAAWVDLLAAQAQRDLYAGALESATVWAEQEQARFRSGEGTRDAAAEAAAQRAAVRGRLAEATASLRAKIKSFNLITALGVTAVTDRKLPAQAPTSFIDEHEETLLDRVLETNPELAAARANEALNKRRVAQAGADHLPTLDLIASATRAQNDSVNTLGARYRNTQVGFQLAVPIFNGGGVSAAHRQAAAAYVAAAADRNALEQKLRIQFGEDWAAQSGLRERLAGASELVQGAVEQRRAAELGVKKGLKTSADLGNAELLLAKRQADLVDATAQLLKAQARVLSLLPISDPAWKSWASSVASASQ